VRGNRQIEPASSRDQRGRAVDTLLVFNGPTHDLTAEEKI
jgi:hypothetical protein